MATIEKRGQFWRVKIRRTGLLAQTRTFDNRTQAQQWARGVESEIDKGIVVDRRIAQRLSLAGRRAALITMRRAIYARIPPGRERDAWLAWVQGLHHGARRPVASKIIE
jgi:hypothetical protein